MNAPSVGGRRRLYVAVILLVLAGSNGHAQGCAACRDNAAATPPATQRAYRHAIILLVTAAGGIFVGAVFLLRKQS